MFLTLVAVVLGGEGSRLEIDKGVTDGLRPGDAGSVFYELTVGGEARRVVLGEAEVIAVQASRALVASPQSAKVRPGFRVEFEIDKERLAPGSTLSAVREHLGEEAAAELARKYLEELGQVAQLAPGPADEPMEEPPVFEGSVLQIAAGSYPVGMPVREARFYNETPRFEATVEGFWIDAEAAPERSLGFRQAQSACEARGMRLATEIEWEVAAANPGFEAGAWLEWTSSWYLPYPGNHREEEEYGKRFRVLKGAENESDFRRQERHYLDPTSESPGAGFRCARSGGS